MHCAVSTTTDPAEIHPGLVAHQQDMIDRCPYLAPSVERGLTTWSAYQAVPGEQAALFAVLVEHAEALRADRRTAGTLACRNIAVLGPTSQDQARRLLQWPAWLARNLYAPVRLMVGRFWRDVELTDSKGEAMLPPPVSFFSLRTAIPSRDGLFLAEKVPRIMDVVAHAPPDDGRDVFHAALGHSVTDPSAMYHVLKERFPVPATSTPR
ncbi:MAG: hypothetical protein M0026_08355 [Nocardiopsaceae bacterium]|nr:hypothetical protein [Nocardiopsaceae bacterium]